MIAACIRTVLRPHRCSLLRRGARARGRRAQGLAKRLQKLVRGDGPRRRRKGRGRADRKGCGGRWQGWRWRSITAVDNEGFAARLLRRRDSWPAARRSKSPAATTTTTTTVTTTTYAACPRFFLAINDGELGGRGSMRVRGARRVLCLWVARLATRKVGELGPRLIRQARG